MKFCLVFFSLFVIPSLGFADTCTALSSGNWSTSGTWSCGRVPQGGDVVVINGGFTVDVTGNVNAEDENAPLLTIVLGTENGSSDGFIDFSGKLNLFEGSGLYIYDGSETFASGPGSSEKIRFYNGDGDQVGIINGNAVAEAGPSVIDQNGKNSGTFPDPLPVDLLFFSGYASSMHNVNLSWATATEQNFEYFEIAHSLNGKDFDVIGTVAGHGNTTTRHDYNFIHPAPYHGLNYYRLKSVDYDGYTEIFPLVAVQLNQQLRPQVFPNPSDGYLLQFKGLDALNPFDIEIISLDGKQHVLRQGVHGNSLILSPSLSQGLYISNITVGHQRFTQRLIVR